MQRTTRSDPRSKKRLSYRIADEFMSFQIQPPPTKKRKSKPKSTPSSPSNSLSPPSPSQSIASTNSQTNTVAAVSGLDSTELARISLRVDDQYIHNGQTLIPVDYPEGDYRLYLELHSLVEVSRMVCDEKKPWVHFIANESVATWFEDNLDARFQALIRRHFHNVIYQPIVTLPARYMTRCYVNLGLTQFCVAQRSGDQIDDTSIRHVSFATMKSLSSRYNNTTCWPLVRVSLFVRHLSIDESAIMADTIDKFLIMVHLELVSMTLAIEDKDEYDDILRQEDEQTIKRTQRQEQAKSKKSTEAKRKRRPIPDLLKRHVQNRQQYKCVGFKCQGEVLLPLFYNIDHIIPFHKKGPDDPDNLQALCLNCHAYKTHADRLGIDLTSCQDDNDFMKRILARDPNALDDM